MSRFGVSDGAAFHRKVVKAGNEAFGAWCRAGSWSSAPENLTDGFIPPEIAAMLAPPRVWSKLRAAGLTDAPADGQDGEQIHGYLEHNPSAEQVRAKRKAWAERQRRHRDPQETSPPSSRRDIPRDTLVESRVSGSSSMSGSGSASVEADPNSPPPAGALEGAQGVLGLVEPPASDPVQVVWEAYLVARRAKFAAGSPPRLTADRRDLIKRRLRDYPPDDLADACRGVFLHEFHVQKHHTDLDLVLRDAKHIEGFRDDHRRGQWIPDDRARSPPTSREPSPTLQRPAKPGERSWTTAEEVDM